MYIVHCIISTLVVHCATNVEIIIQSESYSNVDFSLNILRKIYIFTILDHILMYILSF